MKQHRSTTGPRSSSFEHRSPRDFLVLAGSMILVVASLLLAAAPACSQLLYKVDTFNGGVTTGGWAPSDDGFGTGTIELHFHKNATIVSATLFAGNLDAPGTFAVMLNGHPIAFSAATRVTPSHWSSYGDPSSTHAIDVTADIDPSQPIQTLDVPPQPATTHRYVDFWLVVEYTFPGATHTAVTVALDTQNFGPYLDLRLPISNYRSATSPIAFGAYLGYVCDDTTDGEVIHLNNTLLGTVGGHEAGSGHCAGPMPHFYYELETLVGLGGCGADQPMDTTDVLSDIRTLVGAADTELYLTFDHVPSGTPADNSVWGVIIVQGDTSCTPPTLSLSPSLSSAKVGDDAEFALVTSDTLPPLNSIELDIEIPKDNLELGSATSTNNVVLGYPVQGLQHLTITGNPFLVSPGGVLATLHGVAAISRDSTGPIQLRNLLVNGRDPALIPCGATLAAASAPDAEFTALPVCGSDEIRHFLRTGGEVKGMTILPNPASQDAEVDVTIESASAAELRVIDALGFVRSQMNVELHAGSNRIAADVADLPSAAYIIELRTPTGYACAPLVKVR